MKKGEYTDGTKVLYYRTEVNITLARFATALAENYYSANEPFPEKLLKKDAEKILKSRIFFHGVSGELADGFFEAAAEEGEIFNGLYDWAKAWVELNHPHLKED